jgi:ParB/RepB/Spo0J family partition protein
MTANSLTKIAVSCIIPSPFQHRRMFDEGALRELGNSIERDGLIQPITVRPVKRYVQIGMGRSTPLMEIDKFELIAGERRWRAVQQFTELTTIEARVLEVDDLQARRLCATENLQRADLTSLEEVMALCELVDASLLEFSEEYAPLTVIQEPKWRVKALLTKLDSDEKNGTDYFRNKFVPKVVEIFAGLPKPKDWQSFQKHDLPLLFTHSEVQQFALEHKLNKAQTKAVDALQKAAPEVFKEIAQATPERAIERIAELASDPIRPVAESKTRDIEDVRDLSAETIRQAAKNHSTIQRQQASIRVERSFEKPEPVPEPIRPVEPLVNPVSLGDWWQLGRHKLYCGDTSKPAFYADLPQVDFAFADPPYGVQADEWDGEFYWEHDWLIDKAPIVAVTPGQPGIWKMAQISSMPYRTGMASWITNGMTLSQVGYQNWIFIGLFAKEETSIFRQCQDVIRCTINMTETWETDHRGRKPAEMMAKLIELYCPHEGVVIDPFLGSGTTLLVADETGRSCIGGELSPEYCWRIIQRWESKAGNKAVKL